MTLRFRLLELERVMQVWIGRDPRWIEFRDERCDLLHAALPGDLVSHLHAEQDVVVTSSEPRRRFPVCLGAVIAAEAGGCRVVV